jgi:hypothetical protein
MSVSVAGYVFGRVKLPERWGGAEVAVAQEVDRHVQWFPVRFMSGVIGVEEERQVKIVKERYPQAVDTIQLRLTRGSPWRPVLCIRRREMALWIGGIDPKKCKISAQGPLREFQEELLRAADQLFWKPASDLWNDQPQEGVSVVYMRAEGPATCAYCGQRNWIVMENGVITATMCGQE